MINRNSSSRETKPLHDKRKFIIEFDQYIKIIYILERFSSVELGYLFF